MDEWQEAVKVISAITDNAVAKSRDRAKSAHPDGAARGEAPAAGVVLGVAGGRAGHVGRRSRSSSLWLAR
jgi:hypothetical protein